MDVLHARIQHGVGQGSFHSASVETVGGGGRVRFDYVYDCGAMSGFGMSKELRRAVARLGLEQRSGSLGRGVLDVMVLSHYDTDHLNGAELLSSRFDVGRIFLPYLSPDELLFVIASQVRALSARRIGELHWLANGGRVLWGCPVTMVQGGEGEEGKLPSAETMPQGGGRAPDVADGAPRKVRLTVRSAAGDGGGDTVPATISHQEDVAAELPDGQGLWKLRFWNREPDHGLESDPHSIALGVVVPAAINPMCILKHRA